MDDHTPRIGDVMHDKKTRKVDAPTVRADDGGSNRSQVERDARSPLPPGNHQGTEPRLPVLNTVSRGRLL
ncbi:hypothetical protein [Streptomyces sp. VRA16 Mangrove soil]|uniref:hypothetical protein n=1 Tax=Streptomyces sp. VRA16 Mangrove soil TaxID=2817434 RepID=UPI001A9F91A3|nr:hypothetical protein [Streptomyces sp. VRA16 Mangrove soil]MBO1332661.1 hypothetical protein [Streptomyces sp. VRA16 Mangrove soil]